MNNLKTKNLYIFNKYINHEIKLAAPTLKKRENTVGEIKYLPPVSKE